MRQIDEIACGSRKTTTVQLTKQLLLQRFPWSKHNTVEPHRGVGGVDCGSRQGYKVPVVITRYAAENGYGGKRLANPAHFALSERLSLCINEGASRKHGPKLMGTNHGEREATCVC